jgi:hypothetical protein
MNRSVFIRDLIAQNPNIKPREIQQKWLAAGFPEELMPSSELVYQVKSKQKKPRKLLDYDEIETSLDHLIYQAENVLKNNSFAKQLRLARRELFLSSV